MLYLAGKRIQYPMKRISNLFGEFVNLVQTLQLPEKPIAAGSWIVGHSKYDFQSTPILSNMATGFVLWWRSTKRLVWRINPETANILRTVNLGFIPETPPESWSGQAMVIEAVNGVLFRDVFSMMGYKVMANAGHVNGVLKDSNSCLQQAIMRWRKNGLRLQIPVDLYNEIPEGKLSKRMGIFNSNGITGSWISGRHHLKEMKLGIR